MPNRRNGNGRQLFREKRVNPDVTSVTVPGVMNACSYGNVASNDDRSLQRVAVQSLGLGARLQVTDRLQALANDMPKPYPLKFKQLSRN